MIKSRIKKAYFVLPIFLVGFFLFVFIGTHLDGTLIPFSWPWYLMAILSLAFSIIFVVYFLKIPRITIHYEKVVVEKLGQKNTFKLSDIDEIERIEKNISSWYSTRGGLKLHVKGNDILIPYHIYSNEFEILQRLYGTDNQMLRLKNHYSIKHLSVLRYFYRNFNLLLYLPMSITFGYLLFSRELHFFSAIFLSILAILSFIAAVLTSKYIRLEKDKLSLISPLLMRSKDLEIDQITNLNPKSLRVDGGRTMKSITIELKNRQILTWVAELNRQSELDAMADKINSISREQEIMG